jgi:ribonuclease T2
VTVLESQQAKPRVCVLRVYGDGGRAQARVRGRANDGVHAPINSGANMSPRGGGDTPGDFDVYLLAQSWSPHFCCTNSDRCTTVPWAFSAKHLSLHGLWPGFRVARGGSTFPSSCAVKASLVAETMPREYIDLAPSFGKWNPEKHRAEVGDLAKHEWKKHGTCSGLTPDQYFQEALKAMMALPGDRGTPQIVVNNVGGAVPAQSLRAAYSKQVALRMDKQVRYRENNPLTVAAGTDLPCATTRSAGCPKSRRAGKSNPMDVSVHRLIVLRT